MINENHADKNLLNGSIAAGTSTGPADSVVFVFSGRSGCGFIASARSSLGPVHPFAGKILYVRK